MSNYADDRNQVDKKESISHVGLEPAKFVGAQPSPIAYTPVFDCKLCE